MRDTVASRHEFVDWFHSFWMNDTGGVALKIIITIVVSALLYFVTRTWLSKLVKKIVGRTRNTWDDILYDQGFSGNYLP